MTVNQCFDHLGKNIVPLLTELEQLRMYWPDAVILHYDADKPSILIDGLVNYIVYHSIRPKVERRRSTDYPWRVSILGKTGTVELYDYLTEDQFHYYFHSMGLEGEVKTNEKT